MDTLPRPARTARRPRLTLWLLRLAVTAHLVAVTAQPLLAGLFLTGDVDAITLHGTLGSVLAGLDLLVFASALAYALRGGRLWPIPVAVLQFVAAGLQIGLGHSRALQAHLPLGVAMVAVALVLAIWVWTPAAARPRGGAR